MINPHWKSVPGYFDFETVYDQAVDAAKDGAQFVEIGCWLGRSTCYLGAKIVASGKRIKLYAVDTFQGSPTEPEHQKHGPIEPQFRENIAKAGCADVIEVLVMPSVEAAKRFAKGSLDLVFVDGDHRYESVRADIAAWTPLVKHGGMLAGHDLPLPSVDQAVREAFGSRFRVKWRSWVVEC